MLESTKCSTKGQKERVSTLDRGNANVQKHERLKDQSKEAMSAIFNRYWTCAIARSSSVDIIGDILNIED